MEGPSPYKPDYIYPAADFRPDFADAPIVCYHRGQRLKLNDGQSLGDVYDPYFNRTWKHFCSHRHTPNRPEPSGFVIGSLKGQIGYIAYPIFTLYQAYGTVAYRAFAGKVIRAMLDNSPTVETNLPSGARITLQHQPRHQRKILHLLYAPKWLRGAAHLREMDPDQCAAVEVIEELIPLHNTTITVVSDKPVTSVKLQPENSDVAFEQVAPGRYRFTIDEFTCHQMVELSYSN